LHVFIESLGANFATNIRMDELLSLFDEPSHVEDASRLNLIGRVRLEFSTEYCTEIDVGATNTGQRPAMNLIPLARRLKLAFAIGKISVPSIIKFSLQLRGCPLGEADL